MNCYVIPRTTILQGDERKEKQTGEDKMKQAFTLIELLVVVLIIGILAAIALPQYETAVAKSRFMQAIILGRSLYNAQQIYYLANGTYATTFEDLDLTPSGTLSENKKAISFKTGACNFNGSDGEFVCNTNPSSALLVVSYDKQSNYTYCYAYTELARKVCLSAGGVYARGTMEGGQYEKYNLP
jgi:prepilin-type N-terminal cleavage/methylation domain-containing protein